VVYDRHSAPAFSLAYRMVGTRNAAEDVVQEAFLSLWRAADRYDATRGSVRTWILGIVHNRAIDALRR
jgi:RNA polymerase sigma-70 factor (ECF subfamily)